MVPACISSAWGMPLSRFISSPVWRSFSFPELAIGTSLLAAVSGACGYAANQQQNTAVLSVMKHSFTTIPGILWIVTAAVLFFYRLNRKAYNQIVQEIQERKEEQAGRR